MLLQTCLKIRYKIRLSIKVIKQINNGNILKQQIQEYEDALNETSYTNTEDALLQTKEGCVDCMDRMKTHQDKLANDVV